MNESDETLMAQVARGRREALAPLVHRYATPLLTFIERMVGDRHRSEELFQEVFLAVWRKRHLYDLSRPFKPWLYAIAVNQCRAAFRHPAPPLASVDEAATPVGVANELGPVETAIATETAAIVAGGVALLPAQQRAVVVLRVWQQLSYAEIADALEMTEGTARAHMHYGLCALRKYLEPRLK